MQVKKLLIFGGTFDPPHNGHINLLHNAIKKIKPDKTLVIPSYIPVHKEKSNTNATIRYEMCKCFLSLGESIEISGLEINRKGASYTIDTINILKNQFPQYDLYMAMGSDMLLYLKEWKEWKSILKNLIIVYQNRLESDRIKVEKYVKELQKFGGRFIMCSDNILEISSTKIRKNSKEMQNVPKEAQNIIDKNDLYKENNLKNISIKELRILAKKTLSKKRYEHTASVCDMAVFLAKKNNMKLKKVKISALLHDILKEKSKHELKDIFKDFDIEEILNKPEPLWHSFLGGIYVKEILGIDDEEIASAITCHTTAKCNMSKLDKVIFLADMVCEGREYPGLKKLRKIVNEDLDNGMIKALEMNIAFIKEKGKSVSFESIEALEYFKNNKTFGKDAINEQ